MSPTEFRARIILEASISPSEDPAKVVQALRNVLGEVPNEEAMNSSRARIETEDMKALVHIRNVLRDRHVRSAARRQLLVNHTQRSSFMLLNRQAAAAGVVALCGSPEESPLGPIYLTIKCDKLDSALDWLTAYGEG
jgi:predicted RNA binding protein with dsRBD fold (UPF0201 family)